MPNPIAAPRPLIGRLNAYYSCGIPRRNPLPVTSIDSTTLSFAVLIAIGAIFFVLKVKYPGRRKKALARLAHRLGFTIEGEDWSSSSRAPQLAAPLFRRGEEKAFENIMSMTHEGLTCNFFDYTYRVARSRFSQTVAAFTQDVLLPAFEVVPVLKAGSLSTAQQRQAIDLDYHPNFSARFRLLGPNEEKVRELFTPRVVFFLETLEVGSTWHIEGSDFTLIVYHAGETVNPSEYPAFIEETTRLAKAFLGLDR